YMAMDANTRRTLELTQSLSGREKRGSLFGCLDKTKTGMGARLLKKWIERPEIDIEHIRERLDFVEELTEKSVKCGNLHTVLSSMYDIERLTGRLASRKILPVDFLALSRSLRGVSALKEQLQSFTTPLAQAVCNSLTEFSSDCDLIDSAIIDKNARNAEAETENASQKAPRKSAAEKGQDKNRIFRKGFDAQLDEFTDLIENGKTVLERLLHTEKEETGIRNLKLGFTNVFGYYLEVPKTQLDAVPYRYMRKQTVATGERYVTQELKELEEKILNAQDLANAREELLYGELIDNLSQNIKHYSATAQCVAMLDCLVAFAVTAQENNYVKPTVSDASDIRIREGRHPVVEKLLKDDSFVPNDTFIDSDESKIMLITGPNMAGKSIYMKQVALIVIMAQMGCFVPAVSAEIGVVDKIFTRVGASDDLSSGRSTFMVEMSEV
ncbi:MAG: DNA mismatch repair protein MutS, partial [Clostridiales bacterium]|nr:DNA mismatch repair protein MutS [Clostridiales bacterium]